MWFWCWRCWVWISQIQHSLLCSDESRVEELYKKAKTLFENSIDVLICCKLLVMRSLTSKVLE